MVSDCVLTFVALISLWNIQSNYGLTSTAAASRRRGQGGDFLLNAVL